MNIGRMFVLLVAFAWVESLAVACVDDAAGDGADGGDTEQAQDLEDPTITVDNVAAYDGVADAFAVEVTAADDVGVALVELLVDGEVAASSTEAPYTLTWDTTALAAGAIADVAARVTDTADKTAETAALPVVVINGGWAVELTDGSSGEISIPDPYTTSEEVDVKHHWLMAEGGAARVLAIAVFEPIDDLASWAISFDLGTGYCPDSGTTIDSDSMFVEENPVVFDSEATYPGGGQCFFHLGPINPEEHLGETLGYEMHVYAFN